MEGSMLMVNAPPQRILWSDVDPWIFDSGDVRASVTTKACNSFDPVDGLQACIDARDSGQYQRDFPRQGQA